MNDLVLRLARSTARGHRQMELINEMLAGPITWTFYQVPNEMRTVTKHYGSARVERSSWLNLRNRLVNVGFYFVEERDGFHIEMKFSS